MKKAISTLEQRIQWLLTHPEFLVGKTQKRKIILAMKHDGLISKSTYWPDVTCIEEAVRQAKFRWYDEIGRPGNKVLTALSGLLAAVERNRKL